MYYSSITYRFFNTEDNTLQTSVTLCSFEDIPGKQVIFISDYFTLHFHCYEGFVMITKCLPKQNKTKSYLKYQKSTLETTQNTTLENVSYSHTTISNRNMTNFQLQKQDFPLSLANQSQLHVHF